MSAVSSIESEGQQRHHRPPSMVERMSLILDAFESRATRLTLEEVSCATHLPRSTVHRILEQLVKHAWLEHSAFGYSLGRRSLGLGGGDRGNSEIRSAAAPLLHELLIKTGMTVHLAVLEEGQVHYLDKLGGRFAATVPSRVCGRAPAHSTALGKAMLAWLDAEEVDAVIGSSISRHTPYTIGTLDTLHQELTRIRGRNGLAFERGECFSDIACVAAAVRGPERPVAAISLVGDAAAPLERVAPLVVAAARKVSATLFPDHADQSPQDRGRRSARSTDPTGAWSEEAMGRLMAIGQDGDWI